MSGCIFQCQGHLLPAANCWSQNQTEIGTQPVFAIRRRPFLKTVEAYFSEVSDLSKTCALNYQNENRKRFSYTPVKHWTFKPEIRDFPLFYRRSLHRWALHQHRRGLPSEASFEFELARCRPPPSRSDKHASWCDQSRYCHYCGGLSQKWCTSHIALPWLAQMISENLLKASLFHVPP